MSYFCRETYPAMDMRELRFLIRQHEARPARQVSGDKGSSALEEQVLVR